MKNGLEEVVTYSHDLFENMSYLSNRFRGLNKTN